ncbi:MAG TPA: lactate utilization protein C [Nocardioidaceae bacterium]|nr:lactate utilization protein C [Nocardioidaceae bacterium]
MGAREEILAAVRRALGDVPRPEIEVPRGYRTPPSPEDLVELFAERVADYRAVVSRCGPDEVAATIAEALSGAAAVVVPAGFGWPVGGAIEDTGQGALDLDRVDAVVTGASVGIALTGTIVLDHGPGQGRRALTLVPDLHVCVVQASQVVHGVPEAVALLDPDRPQTWISGPSATSDIELSRVEGVHGPRNLHVIIVG